MFLDGGLLRLIDEPKKTAAKTCREGEIDEIFVSLCKEGE
jgi:hypothetical protein